jgi:acyl carrier protein
MTSDNLLEQLQPIFRDVLDQPELLITEESNGHNVDGWDSLTHINLVSAIEQEFKIRFALGELQDLKNVGDMIVLMRTKLGK